MEEKLIISHIKAGFGNQLFHYAVGFAASKRIGAKFKIDNSFFDNNDEFEFKLNNLKIDYECANQNEIDHLRSETTNSIFFRILKKIGIRNKFNKKTSIYEPFGFKPDKRILNLKHSAYILGWVSNYSYFNDFRSDLLSLFSLKQPFSLQANYYLKKINSCNSVSIHIRRGDYIELEYFFRVLPIEFYKKASAEITKLEDDLTFFVFSNDIEWSRLNLNFLQNVVFVDLNCKGDYNGKADMEEFELMKYCKHNIIANSSFSWWSAYLNKNNEKTVISPKVWFNDKFYQNSYEKNPTTMPNWISL